MPRQERAIRTRANILQAAAILIQEIGYSDMTLAQVSQKAGVAKGALYFHFASKESLATALIDAQHQAVRTGVVSILESRADPLTKMMLLSKDLAFKLIEDPIVRAGIQLTTDSGTLGSPVKGPYQDWIRTFSELATDGVKQGLLKPSVDSQALAELIIPSFTGIQLVSEVFTARRDLPKRISYLWEILIGATVPDPCVAERVLEARRLSVEDW